MKKIGLFFVGMLLSTNMFSQDNIENLLGHSLKNVKTYDYEMFYTCKRVKCNPETQSSSFKLVGVAILHDWQIDREIIFSRDSICKRIIYKTQYYSVIECLEVYAESVCERHVKNIYSRDFFLGRNCLIMKITNNRKDNVDNYLFEMYFIPTKL